MRRDALRDGVTPREILRYTIWQILWGHLSMAKEIHTTWIQTAPGRRAFYAHPVGAAKRSLIVVVFEVFGLNEHFQSVAMQLAQNGYCAVVPDLFDGKVFSYTDIQGAMDTANNLDSGVIIEHITQSIDHLESLIAQKRPNKHGKWRMSTLRYYRTFAHAGPATPQFTTP